MKIKLLYKYSGSVLIELMMSIVISSMIILGLYRSYIVVQKTVNNLSNASELETEKMMMEYHCSNDLECMLLPSHMIDMFNYADMLSEKKEEDSKKNKKKLSDKEKKEIEKQFNQLVNYLPTLKKSENGEIVLSFMSSNALFSKGINKKEAQVSYILRRTSMPSQLPNIFSLLRREEIFEQNKQKKDDGSVKQYDHEYTILSYIEDPKIRIVLPVIVKEKKDEEGEKRPKGKAEEDEKEKKNVFMEWLQKAQFTIKEFTEGYTADLVNKQPSMPYLIIISGTTHSFDGFRSMPLYLVFSVPCAEWMSELFCNFDEKLKEMEQVKKKKSGDKNSKKNKKNDEEKENNPNEINNQEEERQE